MLCKALRDTGLKVLGAGSTGQVLLSTYETRPVAIKLMTVQDGMMDDTMEEGFR